MLAKINSSALLGINAYIIEVEVDISFGLPAFNIVGLPETSVRESRERVKTAVKNSGYSFPPDRVTINLAPADIKKESTGLDLPVAMGILAASNIVSEKAIQEYIITGELSLDGRVKPVKGILPIAIAAKKHKFKGVIVPFNNRYEGAMVEGLDIIGVKHLSEVVEFFSGFKNIEPAKNKYSSEFNYGENQGNIDYSDVQGQQHAKRALEIAAAGSHNILMTGPPGSGKSMLANRLVTILPTLTFDEALETTQVYSIAGMIDEKNPIVTQKPFRSPHHTISDAGLAGGGSRPEPGEASLAHNGVLFLDELPEFKKNVLNVLRQPMENGFVTIARAASRTTFPSKFMLVAAMNPCPCGYLTDPNGKCICSPAQIQRYQSKISGPLLDRIDIHIEVPPVPYKDLAGKSKPSESSADIKKRVEAARKIQSIRLKKEKLFCNAAMNAKHIKKYCNLNADSEMLLEKAVERFGLSARAYARIKKLSRTIADLDNKADIQQTHIAEAIQYRSFDRNMDKKY
ncbi:MAG: YifB family Mg chelatase-like AAA ATPase [Desulfobacteraceae bacterium]|nr:YifB family Mg chelatase-like AAA ATPase [Desulfobacteraceae bacterium]